MVMNRIHAGKSCHAGRRVGRSRGLPIEEWPQPTVSTPRNAKKAQAPFGRCENQAWHHDVTVNWLSFQSEALNQTRQDQNDSVNKIDVVGLSGLPFSFLLFEKGDLYEYWVWETELWSCECGDGSWWAWDLTFEKPTRKHGAWEYLDVKSSQETKFDGSLNASAFGGEGDLEIPHKRK